MLALIIKMLKSFVLAYVALDLLDRLATKIYKKISGKAAEERWDTYLETLDLSRPINPIKQNIN